MTIVGSANIATLDFSVLYDLSGPTPKIKVTNSSTGSGLASCTWWLVVTPPSGIPIHVGSLAVPDRIGAWSTWLMGEAWPLTNGHVEWSGAPYSVQLFVNDGASHTYDLTYVAELDAPSCNVNAKDNFGVASYIQRVRCNAGEVYVQDTTNYVYGSSLGTWVSQDWTMLYPNTPSSTGLTATDAGKSFAYFPISYNANSYVVVLETVRDYLVNTHSTVRIKYAGQHKFNVQCSIQLCDLLCGYQKMLQKASCAPCSSEDLRFRMAKITGKLNLAMISIIAGCTDVDIPKLINDVKKLLGEFDCCCTDDGLNDNAFPNIGCNVILNIYDINSGVAPAKCPLSFYPAPVYAPDGVTVIGTAANILDLISSMNSNPQWAMLGTAVYMGEECRVKFIKNNCGDTIPNIIVDSNSGNTSVIIIDKDTGVPPEDCPDSFYPANVFATNGTTVIGYANSVYDLLAIINSDAGWEALGTAFYIGQECSVGFDPIDPNGTIPDIIIQFVQNIVTIDILDGCTGDAPITCPGSFLPCIVYAPNGTTAIGAAATMADIVNRMNANGAWNAYGTAIYNGSNCSLDFALLPDVMSVPDLKITTGTCCVASTQTYILSILNYCGPGVVTFPFQLYVNYGSGAYSLGVVSNTAGLLAALNADVSKPASVSYTAGVPGSINLVYYNADCTAFSGTVNIYGSQNNFLLYGSNNDYNTGVLAGDVWGMGMKSNIFIGHIPGFTTFVEDALWHTILVANGTRMLVTQQSNSQTVGVRGGRVHVLDVTSPLSPVFLGTIYLTVVAPTNFQGIPFYHGKSWLYDLTFPTDFNSTMDPTKVYVCESATGSIWKININTLTVVDGFFDQRLIGMIPRVLKAEGEKLYYTRDGAYPFVGAFPAAPGAPGLVAWLETSLFATHTSSVGVTMISPSPTNYILAATFDGTYIWFVNNLGTLIRMHYVTNALVQISGAIPSTTYTDFVNIKWQGGKKRIYVSSVDRGTGYLDVSAFPTVTWTPFDALSLPGIGSPNTFHYNFLPLDNCKGVLTFSNAGAGGSGVAIFDLDGNFMSLLQAVREFYNVVAINNVVPPYSPTTLIP